MVPLSALLAPLRELGSAAWLMVQAARGAFLDLIEGDRLAQGRWAAALSAYVWSPLPTLLLLAGLAGIIAGVSAGQVLRLYYAELAVAPALAKALGRDVAPLLIGVFAAGRVSVDMAARLGGMRLGRELEALEALGHDPARYTLAPTLAAVIVAAPVHILAVFLAAWLAAGAGLQIDALIPWPRYVELTLDDATARAILTGMAKTWVYMLIAAAVGAAAGSREPRNATAVGRQATAAFTASLLAIFAAAAVWTAFG